MTKFSIARDFPDTGSESAWMALVEKALKGASFETLEWRSLEGIETKPLYTRSGEGPSSGLPGAAPWTRGLHAERQDPAWDIRQLHTHPEPEVANREILDDLAGGVTSVALRIAAPGQNGVELAGMDGLERLLDGVMLDMAGVSLHAGCEAAAAGRALQAVWTKSGVAAEQANGAFNLDPVGTLARTGALPLSMEQALGEMAQFAIPARAAWPNVSTVLVDATPWHDGGGGEAMELACICATLVAYMRALEAAGVAPDAAVAQTTVTLAADTGQFMTIAKLRAARALIARIAEASGGADGLSGLRLHAASSERMMAASDPWVNMLRTAMACSGAAMGGADSITVLPFTWALGLPNAFARRIARNIQIVLQEESALGAVVDPAGGSWYVESLTGQLARKAWTLFQEIEARGGIVKALSTGYVQSRIANTAEERERAIATSQAELTGVNAYPVIEVAPETVMPHPVPEELAEPAVTVEPAPPRPLSAPFDRLRRAADAHFDQTAARPAVFLATLGKTADFAARAAFAGNFFTAGGIEAISDKSFETAADTARAFAESGAKLACICSSDAVYAELAADTARELRKAGARQVYLAGRAGDARADLRNAGIGAFIHKGCDMLETLEAAHDILGMRSG